MSARPARNVRGDERGIVVVWMAIVVFLLLGIAALAVDVVRGLLVAQQAQNAADAASLAGAPYLPSNPTDAVSTALDNARMNGFQNGVSNTNVVAAQQPDPTRLKVDVTRKVDTFFAKAIGFATITIHRSATAAYDPPVALGSPENSFGYQPYRGVWGAINGFCASREDGDLRASRYYGNRPTAAPYNGSTVCPLNDPSGPATPSNEYDPDGYSYIVEMKQSPGAPVALQVFDGYMRGQGVPCTGPAGGSCPDSGSWFNGTPDVTTTFEVTNLGNTLLDTSDDVPMGSTQFGTTTDASKFNQWDTIAMVSGPGLYRVKVSTMADQPSSVGSNGWALGARVGGTTGSTSAALPRCVNDPDETSAGVTYSPGCPHVYAEKEMSVYANVANATATFYLAEVSKANAGKTMIITLFDPGEGGKTLEVLDPSGNPMSFTWATVDGDTGWQQYTGGPTTQLDISQNLNSPLPNHVSASKFSDRRLELQIKLPSTYAPTGTNWWKLRYTFLGTSVSDRTTWGTRIVGNPVRLVE